MATGGDEEVRHLRDLIDDGVLRRAARRIARALEDDPDDPEKVHALAELLRQQGDLDSAAKAYRRLARLRPRDPFPRRVEALLRGEDPGPPPSLPTRFARFRDFLPEDRLTALREHVRTHRDRFRETKVKRETGDDVLRADTRRSSFCPELGDIRDWFDDLVLERFEDMLVQTGLEPFEPAIRSCKLSAYHDGHFFRLHQDRSSGAAGTRVFGFLFYFDFPPRRFRGGELLLYDRDADRDLPVPAFTNLAPETNMLAVLPAGCWHEVLPVRTGDDDWFAARFTYSGWIHDAPKLAAYE